LQKKPGLHGQHTVGVKFVHLWSSYSPGRHSEHIKAEKIVALII
jgi:hypothetical protein